MASLEVELASGVVLDDDFELLDGPVVAEGTLLFANGFGEPNERRADGCIKFDTGVSRIKL